MRNAAVLVDDSSEASGNPFKYEKYFIHVSDGLVSDLLTDGYALQGTDGALVNMYTDKISQTVSIV